jgi:hypothetical protein
MHQPWYRLHTLVSHQSAPHYFRSLIPIFYTRRQSRLAAIRGARSGVWGAGYLKLVAVLLQPTQLAIEYSQMMIGALP